MSNKVITKAQQRSLSQMEESAVQMPAKRKWRKGSVSATFVIETLMLLVCLLISIAASIVAISHAFNAEIEAYEVEKGSSLASNLAEQFSADPVECPRALLEDGFFAEMTVSIGAQSEIGTLYIADIKIYHNDREVSSLSTGRYIASEEIDDETIASIKSVSASKQGSEGAKSIATNNMSNTENTTADADSIEDIDTGDETLSPSLISEGE